MKAGEFWRARCDEDPSSVWLFLILATVRNGRRVAHVAVKVDWETYRPFIDAYQFRVFGPSGKELDPDPPFGWAFKLTGKEP